MYMLHNGLTPESQEPTSCHLHNLECKLCFILLKLLQILILSTNYKRMEQPVAKHGWVAITGLFKAQLAKHFWKLPTNNFFLMGLWNVIYGNLDHLQESLYRWSQVMEGEEVEEPGAVEL